MNTFPNWIGVNVVHRGHHFKSRRASGTGRGRAADHSHAKWPRLSQRLAISRSIMPLNTLFRHLFCAAAVMHVMLRSWKQRQGRGRGSEGEREAEDQYMHEGKTTQAVWWFGGRGLFCASLPRTLGRLSISNVALKHPVLLHFDLTFLQNSKSWPPHSDTCCLKGHFFLRKLWCQQKLLSIDWFCGT